MINKGKTCPIHPDRNAYKKGVCAACYVREWRKTHPDTQTKRYYKIKLKVFEHYCGGTPYCQCPHCDVKEILFLTVDHINRDGNAHRKLIGDGAWNLYWWLVRNNFPPGFQVLCYNCNYGRNKTVDGRCPHEIAASSISGVE
jgi:hypothetical protein